MSRGAELVPVFASFGAFTKQPIRRLFSSVSFHVEQYDEWLCRDF